MTKRLRIGNHRVLRGITFKVLTPLTVLFGPNGSGCFGRRREFRDPDRISNAWEHLEKVLQDSGYHRAGLHKVQAASDIARYLDVDGDTAVSFRLLEIGVRRLIPEIPHA